MKRLLKFSSTALLGLMASGAAYAGDQFWGFDDSNGTNGFTIVGSQATKCWNPVDGNSPDPTTNGFIQMLEAVGGENCCLVFPDIDAGRPIRAFHLTMDVRAGNSSNTDGRPADGFSISYCREGDMVLVNATNGVLGGAAGGDSAAATLDPAGSGDVENGAKSGVAICFDAWQGNWLPDTGAGGTPGPDVEGIEVRVDDHTLFQRDMSGDRNGGCYGPTNTDCAAAACADPGTEQTGPCDGTGAAAGTGAYSILCWQPLDVELNTNLQVTVKWKGATLVDHFQLSQYSPHRGRLVLMGRTGGNCQNVNFDNIHLVTTPADAATFDKLTGQPNRFFFQVSDNGPSVVTNVTTVRLDGIDVTASTVVIKSGITTIGTYNVSPLFAPGSTHTVDVIFKTSLGQTVSTLGQNFTIPNYVLIPATMSVANASVDTSKNGFLIKPYQTTAADPQPNANWWTEEQLLGLHGVNTIDFTSLSIPTTNGNEVILDPNLIGFSVINFNNGQSAGQFTTSELGYNVLGIPNTGFGGGTVLSNEDNSSMSISAYLFFPTVGLYSLGVNSDDGFRVSFGKNSHDVLGIEVGSASGGRGIAISENIMPVYISQPGYYGVRVLYENGGGGAGVEFYQAGAPNTNLVALINDASFPDSLKAYQISTAAPAYVSLANPGFDFPVVAPNINLKWEITDSTTTLSGTPTITIDGTVRSPVISNPSPGVHHYEVAPAPLWAQGTHVVQLVYQDSGGNTLSNYYTFSTMPTLPTNMLTAPGSGFNPGFRIFTFQSPNTNNEIINGWQNIDNMADEAVEGFYNNNIANMSTFTHNGQFWESGIINYSESSGVLDAEGNFQVGSTPSRPDALIPGVPPAPGLSGDNDAFVARTFVEFPTAGVYTMGVNSDDGFRVTMGDRPAPGRSMLSILKPQSLAGDVMAMDQYTDGNGNRNFGSALPRTPIIQQAVLCDPPWPTAMPNNAAALAGKIAIVHRTPAGGVAAHSYWAQQAGAVAVVVVDQDDVGPTRQPGLWGLGSPTPYNVPIVMIDYQPGTNLIAHATADATSPAVLMISANTHLKLGSYDPGSAVGGDAGGRGQSDTTFSFYVAQPGLYPMRLLWENGGGGAECEWFTVLANGTKLPINDPDPQALKSWIGRTVPAAAQINMPVIGPGYVTVSWSGEGMLEWAFDVTGPWFEAPSYANPITLPTLNNTAFFRVRSF